MAYDTVSLYACDGTRKVFTIGATTYISDFNGRVEVARSDKNAALALTGSNGSALLTSEPLYMTRMIDLDNDSGVKFGQG